LPSGCQKRGLRGGKVGGRKGRGQGERTLKKEGPKTIAKRKGGSGSMMSRGDTNRQYQVGGEKRKAVGTDEEGKPGKRTESTC